MTSKAPKKELNPFGLSGEQFWENPTSLIDDDFVSDRLFGKKDGFLIAAPEKVFLDHHSTVPLVCLHTAETNKFVRHSFKTTTQLVSVCLESGEVELTKLAPSPVFKDNRQHPPGFSSRRLAVDLKQLVNQSMGRHTVMLLCGPEISNQQTIEIIPGKDPASVAKYQNEVSLLRRAGPSLSINEAFTELEIQQHTIHRPDNNKSAFTISQKPEGKSDARITIDFNITGLPRFSFGKTQVFTSDKKPVFAGLPVAFVGFDEERALIIDSRYTLPVTTPLAGNEESPVLQDNVSFLLSKLLSPNFAGKKVSLWCIAMEYCALVEVVLE